MKPDANDEQLQQIFAELRRAERDAVPPFERVWAAAVSRTRQRRPWVWWAIASACAGFAALVGVLQQREKIPGLEAATRLAAWRSPTASLLRSPGDDILRVVPSVGASLMRLETLQPTADTP